MNKDEAIRFLTTDQDTGEDTGHLYAPCSRWGRNSRDCAEVAYDLDRILSDLTGEGMDERTLDGAMSSVVNDHDDVASIFAQYGAEYLDDSGANDPDEPLTLRDKYADELEDWGDADAYNETGDPHAYDGE